MANSKPNPCKCCGETPRVMTGGPGAAWVKCECGMETTDGSVPRVLAIWNRAPETLSVPRACRPERALILATASLLVGDDYLSMSRRDFVSAVMEATNGSVAPKRAAALYSELMRDAGLPEQGSAE